MHWHLKSKLATALQIFILMITTAKLPRGLHAHMQTKKETTKPIARCNLFTDNDVKRLLAALCWREGPPGSIWLPGSSFLALLSLPGPLFLAATPAKNQPPVTHPPARNQPPGTQRALRSPSWHDRLRGRAFRHQFSSHFEIRYQICFWWKTWISIALLVNFSTTMCMESLCLCGFPWANSRVAGLDKLAGSLPANSKSKLERSSNTTNILFVFHDTLADYTKL